MYRSHRRLTTGDCQVNAAAIWRTMLERLETAPIDEVSKAWLQSSHLTDAPNIGADDIDAASLAPQEQAMYFMLQVPGSLARDVIGTRWRRSIEDILMDITGQPVAISVTDAIDDGYSEREMSYRSSNNYAYYESPVKLSQHNEQRYVGYSASDSLEEWDNEQRANILMHNRLNPRYTFDAFIVGGSNRLAHAASLAVAEAPGESYNPLFLYGGVGLGKTHLLHAIGHQGVQTGLAVLYVSSEQFTNEIINAIRYRTTEEFRAKYRSVDILLVDDIQFIAGKESTEEEFFHTFNSLHNANKQIVVTSDRPPKAIHSLQDRLRSRFEWGLLADIQPPEYEHRLAILRSKAESVRFAVPASVIEFVARPECSSVRELEGALNRVIAYATLHDAALSASLAAQALEHIYSESRIPSNMTPTEVLEGVCRYYNVDIERIRGKQRDREIVWPRQIAMYLMRQETSASLLQIGMELGGRDHTTVMHGWEKIQGQIANNDNVRREIAAVLESLQRKE